MRFGVILAMALIAAACAQPSHAAENGFIDCDKAVAPDENAICAHPRLLQEDARMVALFDIATASAGMGTRGDVKDAQVAWLASRHACAGDLACLQAAYGRRIETLRAVIDSIKPKAP